VELEGKPLDSEISHEHAESKAPLPAWIKVSAIAAASALVGGVAAAWFYRKTVSRLQNSEPHVENTDFRIRDGRSDGEV